MMVRSSSPKSRLIQLIHVAKRDLQLDDDTYRHLLTETTKKESTRDMTVPQLERVLATLKARGFVVKAKNAGTRPQAKDPQSKKIRSLWLQLNTLGVLEDCSEAALATYIKRITGVEALQWLNTAQASQVIETLKKWVKRIEVQSNVN